MGGLRCWMLVVVMESIQARIVIRSDMTVQQSEMRFFAESVK